MRVTLYLFPTDNIIFGCLLFKLVSRLISHSSRCLVILSLILFLEVISANALQLRMLTSREQRPGRLPKLKTTGQDHPHFLLPAGACKSSVASAAQLSCSLCFSCFPHSLLFCGSIEHIALTSSPWVSRSQNTGPKIWS